jgi:hypothetical protein
MKLFGYGAALAALMVPPAVLAQGQSHWMTFEAPGGGFRVELPVEPTVRSGDVSSDYGPVHKVEASLKVGNRLECTATLSDYQPGAISTDPQGRLTRTRQNYVTKLKLPVRSEERFTQGTSPGIRFFIDLPDNRVAKYEEILVRDRAVAIVCIVPKGQETSSDITRIYKSFVSTGQ